MVRHAHCQQAKCKLKFVSKAHCHFFFLPKLWRCKPRQSCFKIHAVESSFKTSPALSLHLGHVVHRHFVHPTETPSGCGNRPSCFRFFSGFGAAAAAAGLFRIFAAGLFMIGGSSSESPTECTARSGAPCRPRIFSGHPAALELWVGGSVGTAAASGKDV